MPTHLLTQVWHDLYFICVAKSNAKGTEMKDYDEEYLTDSPEERREKEQREEIKRLARSEIRRYVAGEADEDMAADEQREQEEQAAQEPKRKCPRWLRGIRLFLTGDILVGSEMSRFYNYVSYIALMFFASIVTLFAALRLEMRRDGLEREVELLHERSIRTKELRYKMSSHSAIVERLQERGIELYDPLAPNNVIE